MSKIEVNEIDKQNGSTLTIGGSGTTVQLGTGASQTGFGRTGTVDWQTGSIKTSTFTAANGEGYFADTSSGAITMNLPAGTAGNIVSVADYTNTFQTHNLTISPNGSQKIGGVAASTVLSTEGQSITLVYVDDTEGWKNVQDSTSNVAGNPFLIASGGTETTSGNFKIHTFTGPGTFTVTSASQTAAENIVSYMVVAGGGSGGAGYGGGGGAGGFREYKGPADSYTASPLNGNPGGTSVTVTATAFPITVGGGGAALPGPGSSAGNNGNNSVFSTITATAGGGGGGCNYNGSTPARNGKPGGSGGGAGRDSTVYFGNGNTPPVSPAQGTNGGQPAGSSWNGGGGGGGATAAGGAGSGGTPGSEVAGNGGVGATTSITASPVGYAGGGGGSNNVASGGGTATQGGGAGYNSGRAAGAGTANLGGGGGGGHNNQDSGAGGSGVVVIRYKFQ